MIKLWSLRKRITGNRRNNGEAPSPPGRMFGRNSNLGSPGVDLCRGRGVEGSDGSDALGVLTGDGGRVMCVRAAWHGDRLISGGADKTVRVWDVAGSGSKCLKTRCQVMLGKLICGSHCASLYFQFLSTSQSSYASFSSY